MHVTCAWRHAPFPDSLLLPTCQTSPSPVTSDHNPAPKQPPTCNAAMPPNRTSRTDNIPENLIVNWRPPNPHDAPRTLLRRPVTACDACRAAKAKCSGKQGCDRCTARGLVCTYKSRVAASRCPPSGDGVQTPSTQAMSPTQEINQGVPAVVPVGHSALENSPSSTDDQPSAGLEYIAPAGGTSVLQHQSIHPVNWGPRATALEVSVLGIVLFCAPLG